MSTQFRNTGNLWLADESAPRTEFETDRDKYPRHVGKLYVDGNWYTVEQARELRDYLNTILPEVSP